MGRNEENANSREGKEKERKEGGQSEEVREDRRMEDSEKPGVKEKGLAGDTDEAPFTDGQGWDPRLGRAVRRASHFQGKGAENGERMIF